MNSHTADPWKGELLIYVSKRQLEQVEYLITQSIQGNHVLFDVNTVRNVFWAPEAVFGDEFSTQDAYAVEHHLEKMIQQPTLAQKRAYLDQLDVVTFQRVVRTYFCIVENNLYEQKEVRH